MSLGTSAVGTVSISSTGAVNASASVSVTPLVIGQFRLAPVGGTNFVATLSSAGLRLPAGGTLSYRGSVLTSLTLPGFTISPNGDFSVSAGPATLLLGGFSISNSSFTFRRVGGITFVQLSTGTLTIPRLGGGSLGTASASGTLNSNGTFALTGITGGALIPAGLPIASIQAGATATLTQSGLRVSGSATGGVLAYVSVVGTATGILDISSAGTITLSGEVFVSPLIVNQFRLEPSDDDTFIAKLGANGLTFPQGARLLYRGSSLINVRLPSFSIASNGNFSVSLGSGVISLGGFMINSDSFTFRRQNGVTSVNLGGSLRVPGPSGTTLATVRVNGSLNSNGTYLISGTLTDAIVPKGMPVTSIASATATLNQNGLTISGTASGGVLNHVAVVGSASAVLNVTSAGSLALSGTITVSPFGKSPFRIESLSGGNLSVSFNNSGLRFSGSRLVVTGIFGSAVTLPAFTLPSSGSFSLPVTLPNLSIKGIPVARAGFTLIRSSGLLSINPIEAELNISGFSQRLTGTISSSGSLNMNYGGSLTIHGFTAANGGLHLRNSGLSADGSFNLRFGTTSFGVVSFSGSINYSGGVVSYSLGRTGGGVNFAGFNLQNLNLALSSAGYVTGNATLPYGNQSVPLNNLRISAFSGFFFDNWSKSIDSGWQKWDVVPFTDLGDVQARLLGTITFSRNGDTLKASLSYTWAGFIIHQDCNPPFPFGDGRCVTIYAPDNIFQISAPPRFSSSGSIGTDGSFTVNTSFGGLGSFTFGPFW